MVLGGLNGHVLQGGWHQCPQCHSGLTVAVLTDNEHNTYLLYEPTIFGGPPTGIQLQLPGFRIQCLTCRHWSLTYTMFRDHIARHHPNLHRPPAHFHGNFQLAIDMQVHFPIISAEYHGFIRGRLHSADLQAFLDQVWALQNQPGFITSLTTLLTEQFDCEVKLEWTRAATWNENELSLWETDSATGLMATWAAILYLLKKVNQVGGANLCLIRPRHAFTNDDQRTVAYSVLVPPLFGYEMCFRITSWYNYDAQLGRNIFHPTRLQEYYCKYCHRTLVLGQHLLHLSGRAHFLKFVNSVSKFSCAFCGESFLPCQWDSHLGGRRHRAFAKYQLQRSHSTTERLHRQFLNYNAEVLKEHVRYLSHLDQAHLRWPRFCSRSYWSEAPLPWFEAGNYIFPGSGPWLRISILCHDIPACAEGTTPCLTTANYKPGSA